MNIKELTLAQLKQFQKDIELEIQHRKVADKKNALKQVQEQAAALGYSLEELLGEPIKGDKRIGKTVPPKFKNPENVNETWTGRGRMPVWVQEIQNKYGSLDSIRIE